METAQTWQPLPGRITLQPTGRLVVEPPLSVLDQRRQAHQALDKQAPTPFRVERWLEMREWEDLEGDLDPSRWRSIEELLRMEEAHHQAARCVALVRQIDRLLDPVEDRALCSALLRGGRITATAALFCGFLWSVCFENTHPVVVGTLYKLAELLGCSQRTASNLIRQLSKKKLLHRIPRYERHPEGFKDRDGKRRPKRRISNAYEPGDVLKVAWLRLQEQEAKREIAEKILAAQQVQAPEAAEPPKGEDRNNCDPTPCVDFFKTRGGPVELSTTLPDHPLVRNHAPVEAAAFAAATGWLSAAPAGKPRCDLSDAAERQKWFFISRRKIEQAPTPTLNMFWRAARLVLIQAQNAPPVPAATPGATPAPPPPAANSDGPAAVPPPPPAPELRVELDELPPPPAPATKYRGPLTVPYLRAYLLTENDRERRQALLDWAELEVMKGAKMEDLHPPPELWQAAGR